MPSTTETLYDYIILVARKGSRFFGGGLIVVQQFVKTANSVPNISAGIVNYKDHQQKVRKTIVKNPDAPLVITWGPHVNPLIKKYIGRKYVYLAQSFGCGVSLPLGTPFICLRRFKRIIKGGAFG